MIDNLNQTERARAFWWQIYCKCRQISRILELNSGTKNKAVSRASMVELKEPFRNATYITQKLLWQHLEQSESTEQISLTQSEPVTGIKITSEWLWAYFGYNLFTSQTFHLYQLGHETVQRFTAQEQLEFYQHVSIFFLYLIKQFTSSQSSSLEELEGITYVQFARSLIFLVSEYCHLDIGITRVLDIETYLRNAISADAYLYTTKRWYRDHIFHVIDVCLLGLFLLHSQMSETQTLLTFISTLTQDTPGEDTLIQNWFLAALFHDIGYTLEVEEESRDFQRARLDGTSEELQSTLEEIEVKKLKTLLTIHYKNRAEFEQRKAQFGSNFPINLVHEIDATREEIQRLETQLEYWRNRKTSGPHPKAISQPEQTQNKSEKLDHGVRSFEYVQTLLETLPGNKTVSEHFKSALQAIKNHNLMNVEVVFSKEPLTFLLILCDELQEWGRARIDMPQLREMMMSKIIFPDSTLLPTNRLLNYLFVGIKLDKGKSCGIILNHNLDFCLLYRDATEENFEPLGIWLLKSYNLQRIKIPDNQLQITIAMRNPVCKDLHQIDSPDVCEFSILRDFMRDRRTWRELVDWIESEDLIGWEYLRDSGPEERIEIENLVLHLNKFADAKVLHHDPRDILEHLFGWRKEFIKGARRKV